MTTRVTTAAMLLAFALAFAGCTNTQPSYYGAYPTDHPLGPNHGYEAFAAAPYDPYGSYYQNYGPATPFYYEPPESHRNCDERPCIAYPRDAGAQPLQPEIIALPQKKEPLNPPSTISRYPSYVAPPTAAGSHRNDD